MSEKVNHRPSWNWLPAQARLLGVVMVLSITMACTPGNAPMAGSHAKGDPSWSPDNPESPLEWVQIIVHLDVAGASQYREQAAGIKDPEAAKRLDRQMATAIAGVADRVLRQIEPTGAVLLHRYRTLPLLALRATPAAVAMLKSMPEVLDIEIDRPVPPSR